MTNELRPKDLLREGHGRSKVKGYRLEDYEIMCPFVGGRLCPEKIAITSDYTAHIKRTKEGLPDDAEESRQMCIEELRRFDMTAVANGCETANVLECPATDSANQETMTYTSLALLAARKVFSVVGLIRPQA